MFDEVIHHRLGTLERQLLVSSIIANHIRMRCHLNRDIRIVVQQFNQCLHTIFRVRSEFPTTKLKENIVHFHGLGDRCQSKVLLVGMAVVEP